MNLETQEQVLKAVADRVQATIADNPDTVLTEAFTKRMQDHIRTFLKDLPNDDPIVRRLGASWTNEDAPDLPAKFVRWGLSRADIEFVYDIEHGLIDSPRKGGGRHYGPSKELQETWDRISDAVYMTDDEVRKIDKQAIDADFPRIPKRAMDRKAYLAWLAEQESYDQRATTMGTGQDGYGQQTIGTQYVSDLWDQAFQDAVVAPYIQTFEMTAPLAYLPVAVDMPEMTFQAESTSDIRATAQYSTVRTGSNRVAVNAKKFIIHQVWPGELDEDSIIPYAPFLRRQMARSVAFYTDSVIVNGDDTNAATGNINLVDADPADTKHYLAMDGIRHGALVDNTNLVSPAGGAISLAALENATELMIDDTYQVDWGNPNDPSRLIYLCDPRTYRRIGRLPEVLATKYFMGRSADLMNGTRQPVIDILGHPVLSSTVVSRTLADGTVSTTGASNVYGQVVCFNADAFTLGWKRRIRIETERIAVSDQNAIIASLRFGFGRFSPTGAASGIKAVSVITGVTL